MIIIHLSPISQEIAQQSITKISLTITYLIFYSDPAGTNELTQHVRFSLHISLHGQDSSMVTNHHKYNDIMTK